MVKVRIESSRILETPTIAGGVTRTVMTTFSTDKGLRETISIPEAEFSEDLLWQKIDEFVKHATPLVGQEREILE